MVGLPAGAVLPADISSKDSYFARTQLDAGYTWRLDQASAVNVGYGLVADF